MFAAFAANSQDSQNTGFDGFVSAAYGTNKLAVDGESESNGTSNYRGSFSYIHATGLGVQVDNISDSQTVSTYKVRANDLALHGFYRGSNYQAGVIRQTRDFKVSAQGQSMTLPIDRTFTGLEGQYHFSAVTVYGVTAAEKLAMYNNGTYTGRTNLIEARYFINENLRTDLTLIRSKFSENDFDAKANTAGLGVEYKFNNSPISLFGKYQKLDNSVADISTNRFLVGVTFSMGKNSLRARNQSGASMNPIPLDNQLVGLITNQNRD